MSTTIDQRVVEMKFDNKQFESNVSTTMSTLDKLKQSLNLTGASKGLENVSMAAKNCDMSGLSGAVETVGLKFNAMYSIADQALRNITNSAMATGKRIISALTIDPIKTGFSEYETKINAIQTIMSNTSNKGTTMEDVTRVIGELNTYADKTIYNFAEMTRNIGTFTAAGVGLEESATAIQGIANLAAASGSNSQQASTAMYQLSQALSSGTVKLMDWNSVVNAGMGGAKFQEALKATAREYGVSIDDIIDKNGSFRDSLQEGWLTADILNTTLQKFTTSGAKEYGQSMVDAGKWTQAEADALLVTAQEMEDAATKVKTFTQLWDTLKESAQSGWSQTWEILVGDFEEAKETLTEFSNLIGDIINASAEARNEVLQGWKDEGGRAMLVESLLNTFHGIMGIVTPIKEAFSEIFPPITVKQLVNFTEGLKNLTARFKEAFTAGSKNSENIKRTFKGLFAVLDIVRQAFAAVFGAIKPLFGGMGSLGGGILEVTARFGDWLVKIRDIVKTSDVFNKIMQGIVGVIKPVISTVKELVTAFAKKFVFPGWDVFHSILEGIHKRMTQVGEAASEMKSNISLSLSDIGTSVEGNGFIKFLSAIWKGIKTVTSGIAKAFGSVADGLVNLFSGQSFSGILDIFNALISGGIGVGIMKFLKSVTGTIESFGDIASGVVNIFDGVRGCFEAFQTQLKAGALMKIATAIAILAGSIVILALIDSEKLTGAIGALTMLFAELMTSMSIFSKISGNFTGVTNACGAMIAISLSVLILASALKKIATLEVGELATGLAGVAGLMAIVVAVAKVLGSGGKTIVKGATQMVIFAAAIKILASVCKDLAYLGWEELTKGMVGVGVLLAEVSLFMNTAKFSGKSITTATGIVILASAIKILASACKDFGRMDWGEIGKGLVAIGALLAEIAIFTNLTGNAKHVISTGISLIAIAAAMKIFASATSDFSAMSWGEIGKGLISMAVALAAVTVAVRFMPTNMVGIGIGLIAVSTALLILASALDKMGNQSWGEVAKGLVTLGGAMLILAVGLKAMSGTLTGSASLLVATIALAGFVPILSILGAMSWKSIAKGLISIAGAFAVIGIAGALLTPIVPGILALAGALALIGASIALAGVGIFALGTGLSALAIGLAALSGSLVAVTTGLVSVVSATIVGIIKGLGDGIVAFCEVIINGAPAIGEAIKVLILSLCEMLMECVPVIADTLLSLIVALLDSLVKYTPQIVDLLFEFVNGLLQGLARNIPDLIQSVVDIFMAIFTGALDAICSMDHSALIKGGVAVGIMAGVIAALAAVSSLIPAAMVGAIGMGAIIAELAIIFAALGALAQIPGLTWIVEEGGELMKSVGNAIGGLIGGIVGGVAEGITSALPEIGNDLADFMTNIQPFVEGAKLIDPSAMDGVKSLVGIILALTGANILENLTSWLTGGSSLTKFGEELASFGPNIRSYADSVTGIDASAVEASAHAAKALAEMTSCIPNEGGLVSWFTGENSISKFGSELISLGSGLKGFSESITGVNSESIISAAGAAKALAEMTECIPNEGGMVSWFTGENSVSKFSGDLLSLGMGIQGFATATVGIVPESIIAAAGAAKALAEMTTYIPNEGGMMSWFTGENSVSKFSGDLLSLGIGLKGFATETAGIVPETITAAANAAKSLAEMTSYIPNSGGMVSWFTGEDSVSKFSGDLVILGNGLSGFAIATAGIVPETVVAAANAAKALAEMTTYIPNEGGMVSWFTGENSVSKFGADLIPLGMGLKGFSDSVTGIMPETVTAAAGAAKTLAEMTSYIPNEGGVKSWFSGETSVSKFADQLPKLGTGLKGFSDSVTGIVPETINAASGAAKSLAEMTSVIPKEGGIKAWFTGETSISTFADKLPKLGTGLKGFSDSVKGISPENVTSAANAAKSLGEMTSVVPKSTDKILDFGDNLVDFGSSLKSYFEKTKGITGSAITASDNAIEAVEKASTLNASSIKSVAKAIDDIVDAVKGMAKVTKASASNFKQALTELGKTSSESLIKPFKDSESKMKKTGQEAIEAFVKGMKGKLNSAKTTCTNFVSDCAKAISNKSTAFKNAAVNLVKGFANGISENTYRAEAKARAMANAAAKAAKKALNEHSPSKVFYKIGDYAGLGFVNALDDYSSASYVAGSEIASSARNGLRDAIAKVADIVNGDMDLQPTISPVLDLSNIRAGAGVISSMLGSGSSIRAVSNAGVLSTMMNRYSQNGVNNDIVSAINKLRDDINNLETASYTINGITYDDGSNISEAIQTLVRAAKMERRT